MTKPDGIAFDGKPLGRWLPRGAKKPPGTAWRLPAETPSVSNGGFLVPPSMNDRDATKARNQGAGIVFQGRPCRTEAVRANRTVSEDEAREVLGQYVPILRLEEISQDVAQSHGIAQGILVEFKNFDPDRDIQTVIACSTTS
ncbi:hypothetical protein PG984_016208 [Apiospora sp. TS-2023a]